MLLIVASTAMFINCSTVGMFICGKKAFSFNFPLRNLVVPHVVGMNIARFVGGEVNIIMYRLML